MHKIISELNKLLIQQDTYKISLLYDFEKISSSARPNEYRVSDIWDAINIPVSYHLQKNPGMNLDEFITLVRRLQLSDDQLHNPLKVHQVDVDTFCLFRELNRKNP